MVEERRVRTRTPEWQALAERIDIAMGLTAQLNALPFADLTSRRSVLTELLGKPLPESVHVMPPFYCTYGLGLDIGGRSSIGEDYWRDDRSRFRGRRRCDRGEGRTSAISGHRYEPSRKASSSVNNHRIVVH
ncbi:hypothetical protein BH10ACT8_BH10ACT8_01760 [soil metagenome]